MNLTPTAFFSFVREFTGQVMSDNRIESVSANHQKGKVVAQIVKGNIPVQNGVIHFISKPLVIINSNLYDVLAVSERLHTSNSSASSFSHLSEIYQQIVK